MLPAGSVQTERSSGVCGATWTQTVEVRRPWACGGHQTPETTLQLSGSQRHRWAGTEKFYRANTKPDIEG